MVAHGLSGIWVAFLCQAVRLPTRQEEREREQGRRIPMHHCMTLTKIYAL